MGHWLGEDLHSAEVLINVDHDQPSWWVWVTDDMVPSKVEERSGIDDENYVIITEEHVVDGIANFMAKCMISHPKARVPGNLNVMININSSGCALHIYILGIAGFGTRGAAEK